MADNPAGEWLCHNVLLPVMACLVPLFMDPSTLPSNESCPAITLYGVCFPRTRFNTTAVMPCKILLNGTEEDSPKDLPTMKWFCNGTTRYWEKEPQAKACFEGISEEELARAKGKNITADDITMDNFQISSDDPNFLPSNNDDYTVYHVLERIATFGYGSSLIALTVAIGLFTFMRRVMCMRVVIHINLMMSFFLRGLTWILHRPAQFGTLSNSQDLVEKHKDLTTMMSRQLSEKHGDEISQIYTERCGNIQEPEEDDKEFWCHFHATLLNYFSIANYYWLLVEGIYLLLLLKALSYNKRRCMSLFILLGWVFPAVLTVGYILVKSNYNTSLVNKCWSEDTIQHKLWWIVKGPILISLTANFVIYIMVLRIVASKLTFNRHTARSNRRDAKWRLAKSTLSLIPLLGIQYLVTGFIDYTNEKSNVVKAVKYFEIITTSVQGFLVAVIYCFLSGEIQEELKKIIRSWKLKRDLRRGSEVRPSIIGLRSTVTSRTEPSITVVSSIRDKTDELSMNTMMTSMTSSTKYVEPVNKRDSKKHSNEKLHSNQSLSMDVSSEVSRTEDAESTVLI